MAEVDVDVADLEFVTRQHARAVSIGDVIELPDDRVGVVSHIDSRARRVSAEVIPKVTPRGIDKAKDGFRQFSGMEPAGIVTLPRPSVTGAVWYLGTMTAVEYETVRDGKTERYRHEFKKKARPALGVTIDALQLVVLGGGYRVTDRGITDDT